MDNVIYCFNISTYNALPEQRYVGHENSTFYIKSSLSPDCRYLVSGSSDKNAYIWNVKCPEPLMKLTGHWAEVTCAAWCQVGDIKIVTCSDDARHKIWRIGPEMLEHDDFVLGGRAELVPRLMTSAPTHWGADATPSSSRRRCVTPDAQLNRAKRHCSGQNANSNRKTKRCLIDTMNVYQDGDDTEDAAKKPKLDMSLTHTADENPQLLPAGIKRTADQISNEDNPIKKRYQKMFNTCNSNLPQFNSKINSLNTTPTKNKSPRKCVDPDAENSPPRRSVLKASPSSSKIRIITFTTPTKNLPNYVLDGEAPHLRLMSPVKKKQETTNWLTRMTKEKKGKGMEYGEKATTPAPLSPRENLTVRRNSTSDRSVKPITKTKPLLKYFTVTPKKK
ncbi:Protein lethal(2)denticleless [Eumeta japonica]|uniref:Protein lethal(2)denticleless n=1 Tax=Eumeta variegata TaxID=151549 RepID=A0A4C1WEF4_EUMVA|nr:Protein lethal(2)denticleless [Eumeta japonica]